MNTLIINTKFLFLFLLSITIFIGCGKSEKEKVDEFYLIYNGGNYRKVVLDYQKLISELNDTLEIKRAKEIFDKSNIIVNRADSLISLVDSLANFGFNLSALKYAKEASGLIPRDSIINNKLINLPEAKTPKYSISGKYRSARFDYVFHTRWEKEELIPTSVDITITNLYSSAPTALAFYVPSFYYLEVGSFGYRLYVVVADPNKWDEKEIFHKPIFYNQSLTGNVTYSGASNMRENTNISLSNVFKSIILGKDARFYLNIVGTRETRFRGMSFIGYE